MIDIDKLVQDAHRPLVHPGMEVLAAGEPYRRFLHLLVGRLRPQVALEIGVEQAYCSAMMASACPETLVIGIDSAGLTHSSPARKFPNFRFLFCDSLGAAEVVRGIIGDRRVGVVFQDSSHHAEPSRLEWEYYQPLLAEEFVWVCDDVTPAFRMPDEPRGMVDYFDALPGTKRKYPGLHVGNAIGVVTR